jgi:hypothetical protein
MLRLDRDDGKLHGFLSCGCGERAVAIPETADAHLSMGIDYAPRPDLRRADLIASSQA